MKTNNNIITYELTSHKNRNECVKTAKGGKKTNLFQSGYFARNKDFPEIRKKINELRYQAVLLIFETIKLAILQTK